MIARQAQKTADRTPLYWIAVLALLAILIPVNFSVGSLTLSPIRIVLLAVSVPLGLALLAGRFGRVTIVDILVCAHAMWLFLSVAINNPSDLLQFGGSNVLETLGGYLVGRAAIRDAASMTRFTLLFLTAIVLMIPLAAVETQTGWPVIPRILQGMGFDALKDVDSTPRLGLHRAQVVFAHPIQFGIFCVLAVSFVLILLKGVLPTLIRHIAVGLVLLGTFLSVSSGAVLPGFVQLALAGWAWVTGRFKGKWYLLLGLAVPVYLVLEVASDRPAYIAILSILSFNSANAYYRVTIFEWGLKTVVENPFFGIGLSDWVRPAWMHSGSVDNFWLLVAMRYGVPAFLLIALAIVISLVVLSRRNLDDDPDLSRCRLAWVFTITGLCLSLATVHLWGAAHVFFMLLLGAGQWLWYAEPATVGAPEEAEDPPRELRYSRFRPGERKPLSHAPLAPPVTAKLRRSRGAPGR